MSPSVPAPPPPGTRAPGTSAPTSAADAPASDAPQTAARGAGASAPGEQAVAPRASVTQASALLPSDARRIGPPTPAGRPMIVCGDGALALRVVQELRATRDDPVVAIVASRRGRHAREMATVPGVRLIEAQEPTDDVLREAGIVTARAVALLSTDDMVNIHRALRAQELNPNLRLVLRIYNSGLGRRIATMFTDCAVLSQSAMAAPWFVASALGERTPSLARIAGRTLRVVHRGEVPDERVLCGLADTSAAEGPRLLPADEGSADLVLAMADRTVTGGAVRRGVGHRIRGLAGGLSGIVGRGVRWALAALFCLLVLTMVLLATAGGYGWADAAYLTLLDAAGAANPDLHQTPVQQFTQVFVTVVGVSVIPIVTASVVDAVVRNRLTGSLMRPRIPHRGHVVVVGLGNVGRRTVAQLNDLGAPVVCVEQDPNAFGVSLIRRLRIPLLVGDATRMDTLRAAHVETCRALVVVASDDVTNLEVALHARALREDLRVVLRMHDDDLAQRVQRTFRIGVSQSASRLAAPAFGAAMAESRLMVAVPVGRRMVRIADVPVAEGSELDRATVGGVRDVGEARVIGLTRASAENVEWAPPADTPLQAGDRILVAATRLGLRHVVQATAG